MRNTLFKISSILLLGLMLCGINSCQKPFKMKTPLLVDRDEFYLPATAGFMDIIVYSTGNWTADFEVPTTWAELEFVDNGSLTGVRVKYKENTNISRGVNIVFKAGDLEERVYFAQMAGMKSPMIVFEKSIISLLKVGSTLYVPVNTNLSEEDLAKMEVEIKYVTDGDPGGWLSDFHMEEDVAVFTVADNNTGLDRSAIVNVEVPGAYPGEGAGSSITVNQAKEDVEVAFTTGDVNVPGLSQNISFGYKINFDTDLYKEYTLNYGFVGADGKVVDWIKNVELTSNSLNGRTRVNQSEPREATAFIEVLKDSQSCSKVTAKITQEKADAELTDGDSDEKQDKDEPEDF